jgi:hypothetical protein
MVLFNSFGQPFLSVGPELRSLTRVGAVAIEDETPGRKWMESVIRAGDGALYGYYHAERTACAPRAT